MRRLGAVLLNLMLLCTITQAATTTVMATGSCPTDPTAVQSAINNAAPGDTIQLSPGSAGLFNFGCLSATTGAVIQTPALSLTGIPGGPATVLRGPGMATGGIAILVIADDVTVTGLDFQGFSSGVVATNPAFDITQPGPANVSITHSQFEGNQFGVLVLGVADHFRFSNNTIRVPVASPSSSANVGIAMLTRDNDLLIADNTIIGPGPSGLLTSPQQLVNESVNSENALFQTIGIQQIDVANPTSVRGRISGNTLTGLDYGLQSSSNFGVVMQNTATNCEIGMALSNDVDDGISRVTNSLVSGNKSVHNKIGFVVFSGTQNTIALNDFSDNDLAGLFFAANPGGAASVGNQYGCNQGTVENAKGNQSIDQCSRGED